MTTTAPEVIEVPEGHGLMSGLNNSGDARIMWDRNNPDEVRAAREAFESLTKPKSKGGRGHVAYKAEGKNGERGEVIRKFDPEAERIILVPQIVGG